MLLPPPPRQLAASHAVAAASRTAMPLRWAIIDDFIIFAIIFAATLRHFLSCFRCWYFRRFLSLFFSLFRYFVTIAYWCHAAITFRCFRYWLLIIYYDAAIAAVAAIRYFRCLIVSCHFMPPRRRHAIISMLRCFYALFHDILPPLSDYFRLMPPLCYLRHFLHTPWLLRFLSPFFADLLSLPLAKTLLTIIDTFSRHWYCRWLLWLLSLLFWWCGDTWWYDAATLPYTFSYAIANIGPTLMPLFVTQWWCHNMIINIIE